MGFLLTAVAGGGHADELPLQPERRVSFETDEGTWLSLDVSPDGERIAFELLGDVYEVPVTGGRAQVRLSGSAFDSQPVYSPDGAKLAFISDRSGNENVWIADADGGNPRRISGDCNGERFSSPAWSADGRYIYVSRRRKPFASDFRLWMYHVDGGSGIKVTGRRRESVQALGAYASVDGEHIYYASSGAASNSGKGGPLSWQIVRRSTRTGQVRTILNAPGGAMRPVVSPDGRHLTYGTRSGSNTELRVRDLSTGEDRRLVAAIDRDMQEALATRDLLPGYDFTPDGEAVIVPYGGKLRHVALHSGQSRVIPFTAAVDLGIGPDLSASRREPEEGPVRARVLQAPAVSPDGRRLAFSAFGKLYAMSLGDREARRLTSTPLERHGATEQQPAFSPDGEWLVYVSWAPGGGHIYRLRLDGSEPPERLTPSPAFYRKPVFTPKGDEVVALRSSAHDRRQRYRELGEFPYAQDLIRVPSDGGPAVLLAKLARRKARSGFFLSDWGRPHFSREPGTVYVHAPDGLIGVPLEGGTPRRIIQVTAPEPARDGPGIPVDEVRLAPDGEWALALHGGQLHLFATAPVGREDFEVSLTRMPMAHRQITEIGADYFSWSNDGRTIHWAVGSTLYSLALSDVDFTVAERTDGRFAGAAAERIDVTVTLPRDIPRQHTVLRGATVVTMRGEEVIESGDIVIAGDRIQRLGPGGEVEVPAAARTIDVSGKFITPGFVDAHAHWLTIGRGVIDYDAWQFPTNLAYGVTAGLDVQAFTPDIFVYQDLIDAGVIPGPRAWSVGRGLFSDNRFSSRDHASAVLTRYKDHYRTANVKAYMSGNRLQRQFVIEAAAELGLIPTTEGGADTKLDLTHAIDGFAGNEHTLPAIPLYRDIVELYARTGIGYTPTLLVGYGGPSAREYFYSRQSPLDDRKAGSFMPRWFLDNRARRRHAWFHDQEFVFEQAAESAAKILRAGGRVGVGSHGEMPGLGYHWEMQALASGGLDAREVLQMATRGSAEIIGRGTEIGTLAPGRYADLIVFGVDPREDIRNTQSIEYVMKNGRLYDADVLSRAKDRAPARQDALN